LADRFGPLPEVAQNLMFQLRLKALARDAGVGVVTLENGRLTLRSSKEGFDRDRLRRSLDGDLSVSRYGIWLTKGPDWRDELVRVLKGIAGACGT
jgi:transcription-repair coupling factor (superfamily II helicase)